MSSRGELFFLDLVEDLTSLDEVAGALASSVVYTGEWTTLVTGRASRIPCIKNNSILGDQ